MKILKSLFIGFSVIAGLVLCGLLYFATQVSAVYDPLETYTCYMDTDELRQKIDLISKDTGLTYILTGSTGHDENYLKYYAVIKINNGGEKFNFSINYEKDRGLFWETNTSTISLTSYEIDHTGEILNKKNSRADLIRIFETHFIDRIRENTSR